LEPPISTEEAIREGRRLADEVRVELANAPEGGLDEVMRQTIQHFYKQFNKPILQAQSTI
jgi:hypothetical protein